MNNYEYIIASLPEDLSTPGILEEIKSQCSEKDIRAIDFLLDGFNPDKLDRDFYLKALAHPSAFIRGYFGWDLLVRNTRTTFLNKALGRPEDKDLIIFEDMDDDPALVAQITGVLDTEDILEREKGLDRLMWEKAEELVELDIFSLDIILSFIARLQSAVRWFRLDPQSGRELFRKLVEEIRKTKQI